MPRRSDRGMKWYVTRKAQDNSLGASAAIIAVISASYARDQGRFDIGD